MFKKLILTLSEDKLLKHLEKLYSIGYLTEFLVNRFHHFLMGNRGR